VPRLGHNKAIWAIAHRLCRLTWRFCIKVSGTSSLGTDPTRELSRNGRPNCFGNFATSDTRYSFSRSPLRRHHNGRMGVGFRPCRRASAGVRTCAISAWRRDAGPLRLTALAEFVRQCRARLPDTPPSRIRKRAAPIGSSFRPLRGNAEFPLLDAASSQPHPPVETSSFKVREIVPPTCSP